MHFSIGIWALTVTYCMLMVLERAECGHAPMKDLHIADCVLVHTIQDLGSSFLDAYWHQVLIHLTTLIVQQNY